MVVPSTWHDRRRRSAGLLATFLSLLTAGCALRPSDQATARRVPPRLVFTDVSTRAGLEFTHEHGSALPLTILEAMSGGVALADVDGDGWLDAVLVNAAGPNQLFLNRRDGSLRAADTGAGVADGDGYGMGVCAGDYDNDGRPDLFLANHGRSTLLHNEGRGRFADRTTSAGLTLDLWSVSCVFLDYDRDGWLDLYVANYLDFEGGPPLCQTGQGPQTNCEPHVYPAQAHTLLHNQGDGTFRDVSQATGIARHEGRGMGAIAVDYNDDGWPDIVVANDGDPNFVFLNRGDSTFSEVGVPSGVGYALDGRATSSMGIDVGDVDGDGRFDIAISTYADEPLLLLRSLGQGWFSEESARAGLAQATLPQVGWGLGLVDFDLDGDKDLLVVNGHVRDNTAHVDPGSTFEQPARLFENRGGVFTDVSASAGAFFARPIAGRGAAFGDLDNDGDVDALVSVLGGRAVYLRNDSPRRGRALVLDLWSRDRAGARRSAVGARVTVRAADRTQVDEVRAGGSYASCNDARLVFGVGLRTSVDVHVRWPDGSSESFTELPTGCTLLVEQGTRRRPRCTAMVRPS